MGLGDVIGRWIGKVEVVLAGADEDLREGQDALAEGDALKARAAAHRVLARAPGLPLGLALLADACEAGGLEAELAMTLEELSKRAPSRAEVWVRLGRARRATGAGTDEVREAFVRGLAVAESGSEERRDALVELRIWTSRRATGRARSCGWSERRTRRRRRSRPGGRRRGCCAATRRARARCSTRWSSRRRTDAARS